jgi:hypothetical protein
MMPYPIDYLTPHEHDELYKLKKDIEIGERSDFGRPALTTYLEMQIHAACHAETPWYVTITVACATVGAHWNCEDGTDSRGDHWIQAHKDWKIGEQAA